MPDAPAAAPAVRGLGLDPAAEARRIADAIARQVHQVLHRRGVVVAMSGGVDSAVCAALAARALGAPRVLGLSMPESESHAESEELAREWANALGIEWLVEDITPLLRAAGCYHRRDAAIRRLVPEFGEGWGCKVTLPANRPDARPFRPHGFTGNPSRYMVFLQEEARNGGGAPSRSSRSPSDRSEPTPKTGIRSSNRCSMAIPARN